MIGNVREWTTDWHSSQHQVHAAKAGRIPANARGGLEDASQGVCMPNIKIPRIDRLREGLAATSRIVLLGIAMDVMYQLLEFNAFYPVEALLIAVLLAFVHYLLIRGPVTRIARWWRGSAPAGGIW
jgi:hypothetical protein